MTISLSDNTPRISYTVNEGATQTAFTVPFEFFAEADLNFYVNGIKKTLTTHYTISGGNGSTGTINTTSGNSVTGASGGSTVVITRSIALSRTTDFPVSGSFSIDTLNTELDRFVAIQADNDDTIDRALHLQDSDSAVSMELPLVAVRKGTVLGFNASTGAAEVGPTIANVNSLSAITTNINVTAGIAENVTIVAGIASNVTTVAGIASNVTSVAGAITNINALAASAVIADMALLGNADVIADMALLATSDVIADMNTLATSDIVSDLNTLATSDIVSDINTLATSDIVSDLNTLATSDIVSDMNTLATSDIVSDINILATSDIVSDLNTLATSDIVTDLNLLATSAIVEDLSLLATSDVIADMAQLAGSGANPNITTLTASGDITGGTFAATGDTAAGDNASIGYTSAEGIIITGQGSTNDVTIKNDADADVIEIPTGTTNVTVAGNLGVGGTVTGTGTSVFASLDISGDIDVDGTTNLDIVDIDGAVDMATTLQVDGVATFTGRDIHSGGITIANDGQIGSVGDADAIAIASNGQVTFTQTLIGTALDISGDIDVDGTTNLDVVDIDGAVDMASTLTLAGNADFNGDLDVDGTTNLDVVDVDGLLTANRQGSDGNIIDFKKDDSAVGTIGTVGTDLYIGTTDTGLRFLDSSNTIIPARGDTGATRDDAISFGTASARYDNIYATNATIQTSDQTEKQDIAALTSTEMLVGKRISALFKTFRWKDKVASKGDNARTHTGIIAQDVQAAFTAEGLDAGDYSLFISSTWLVDSEGNEVEEGTEDAVSKTRMGIRYPELLSFLAAYNEQRFANIETRLTTLEG